MAETEMVTVKTPPCAHCGKDGEVTLPKAAWVRYQEDGAFIQVAWPEGTAGEREQLISGTHPACFDEMFPPDEEY